MVAFEGLLRQQEDVLAASIACHSAIRASKPLTEPEMRALLEQLESTDNLHGRPTLIHFSSYNMERGFGRRQGNLPFIPGLPIIPTLPGLGRVVRS